jgi:hypothetical protein
MKCYLRGLVFGLLAFVGSVGQLQAALLEFTSRAAWENATPGFSNVTFTGESDGTGTLSYDISSGPHYVDGVGFSTLGMDPTVYGYPEFYSDFPDASPGPRYMGLGSGEFLLAFGSFMIELPAASTGFGLDLRGLVDTNNIDDPTSPTTDVTTTFFVELSNGKTTTIVVTNPTSATDPIPFMGLSDLDPFSWVKISASSDTQYMMIDNVSYGITTIPEPSTLAIFGLGAFFVRSGLKRRKR